MVRRALGEARRERKGRELKLTFRLFGVRSVRHVRQQLRYIKAVHQETDEIEMEVYSHRAMRGREDEDEDRLVTLFGSQLSHPLRIYPDNIMMGYLFHPAFALSSSVSDLDSSGRR
jgi:hypothetical protein